MRKTCKTCKYWGTRSYFPGGDKSFKGCSDPKKHYTYDPVDFDPAASLLTSIRMALLRKGVISKSDLEDALNDCPYW